MKQDHLYSKLNLLNLIKYIQLNKFSTLFLIKLVYGDVCACYLLAFTITNGNLGTNVTKDVSNDARSCAG